MDQHTIHKIINAKIRWDIINKIKDVATKYEDEGHDVRIDVYFDDIAVYEYSTVKGDSLREPSTLEGDSDELFDTLNTYRATYSYVVKTETGYNNAVLTYEMCNRLRRRLPNTTHIQSGINLWYRFSL